MVCGGFYLKFASSLQARNAAEAVRDISDAAIQSLKRNADLHSNWNTDLVHEGNVLYVDGETPMYSGEYAARETDIGTNLFQKICMAIACRWPDELFSGRCGFADTVSGAEHGIIVEYQAPMLRFWILWTDQVPPCSGREEPEELPFGPHALQWKFLSQCDPSRRCPKEQECNVHTETQLWQLQSDRFVQKQERRTP